MALVGWHITCNMGGAQSGGAQVPCYSGAPQQSQNMTAAGTSTVVVPATGGPWVLTVTAVADSFVAYGPASGPPNAGAEPRDVLLAGTKSDRIMPAGTTVTCALA